MNISPEVLERNLLTLKSKRRRIVCAAQAKYVSQRNDLPVEKVADLIFSCLKNGSLARNKVTNKIRVFGSKFDLAIEYGQKMGWLEVITMPASNYNGSGPVKTIYGIKAL